MIVQPNNQATKENPVGRFMVAVGAVIEQEQTEKILVIQRALDQDWQGGEWEIDYGRLDQFEEPVTGLKRELFEETGLKDLTVGQILSVWHIYRGPKKAANELIGITYYCKTAAERITLSKEHVAYQWVSPQKALQLIKIEGIRRDVQKYLEIKTHQSRVK